MDWEDSEMNMPPVEEEEQMNNFFGSEDPAPTTNPEEEENMMGMMEAPQGEGEVDSFGAEPEVEVTQSESTFMPMDNLMGEPEQGASLFGHASASVSNEVARRFEEERKAKVEVIDKANKFKEEFQEKRKNRIDERFKIQKDREEMKQEEETEGEGGNLWKKVYELVQEDPIKVRKPKKIEEKKEGEKKKKPEVLFKKKDVSRYFQLIKNYSYGE